MRPAEIWLMTVEPTAPLVGLELDERGVLGRDRARRRRGRRRTAKAACASLSMRSGSAVSVRAHSRVIRWPETNSARSHQCEPMSAKAREAPPSVRVDAPVVVLRAQQPVLQVAAVEQPQRAGRRRCARARAPRARWGSSGRRTARRRSVPASAAASASACAPSRVERDRLLADHVLAGGQRGLRRAATCRWLGVQMWTTSTSRRLDQLLGACRTRARRRAPPPRGGALSGEEAATPTRRAPASRADRAWTAPMNPVPAMATRTRRDMRTNVVTAFSECQAKACRELGRRCGDHCTCHRGHFSRF